MAKVLFALQVICFLVIFPVVPGLPPNGSIALIVSLAVTLVSAGGTVVAVHGPHALLRALGDAFSWRREASVQKSVIVWRLVCDSLVPLGLLGGLVGAEVFLMQGAGVKIGLALALFAVLWALLGLTASRMFAGVCLNLSKAAIAVRPMRVSPRICREFALTSREAQVADLVLSGLTCREAGEKLFVAESTVKTHLLNVYRKTGASGRLELLAFLQDHED